MKTTTDFYDMTTLRYLVIKEKFEQMWVIAPYFVWVAVSEALLFWVIVGGALFWVGGGGWGWVGVSEGGCTVWERPNFFSDWFSKDCVFDE